jgi:hypothetical protein
VRVFNSVHLCRKTLNCLCADALEHCILFRLYVFKVLYLVIFKPELCSVG